MSGSSYLCVPVMLIANINRQKHFCFVFLFYFVFVIPILASSNKRTLVEIRRLEKTPLKRLTDGGKSSSRTDDLVTNVLGRLLDIGREENAEGKMFLLPADCRDDEKGFARLPQDWVAVLNYSDKVGSTTDAKMPEECSSVVDRMRRALVFGASAIIILTLNQRIIKELDVSTLFSKPVVLVEGAENITNLLQLLARMNAYLHVYSDLLYTSLPAARVLNSKMKLKAKLIFNISQNMLDTQKFFTTVTLWSACGRSSGRSYHEWDGVVCLGPQNKNTEGKVDQENFWNYFYSAILVLMMIHYLRTRRGQDWEDQDYIEGHIRQLAYKALAVMKIKRYSSDGCQDTCAICLEQFFPKQKLRVLPCGHHFHTKCVDPWLVRSHTCPLCKLDVIEQLQCSLDE